MRLILIDQRRENIESECDMSIARAIRCFWARQLDSFWNSGPAAELEILNMYGEYDVYTERTDGLKREGTFTEILKANCPDLYASAKSDGKHGEEKCTKK